jgi:hypothetical protein
MHFGIPNEINRMGKLIVLDIESVYSEWIKALITLVQFFVEIGGWVLFDFPRILAGLSRPSPPFKQLLAYISTYPFRK